MDKMMNLVNLMKDIPLSEVVLNNVVGEFLKDLYSFTKGLVVGAINVEEEIEKLSNTVPRIKALLKDAEDKRIVEDEVVLRYLRDLRTIVLDADDVTEEFHAMDARLTGILKWKRFSYPFDVASRVKDIQNRYENINNDRRNLISNSDTLSKLTRKLNAPPSVEDSSMHDHSQFYGRNEEMKKLIHALEMGGDSNLAVISIEGVGGIGKTTLAKAIFTNTDDKLNFESRIWIDMSEGGYDVSSITRKIIESASGNKECHLTTLDSLHERLQKLLSSERFLLVLDNVGDVSCEQCNKLKAPLDQNKKGSRILVTTRKTDVSRNMRASTTIYLGDLEKEECWHLFQDRAFAKGERNHHLEIIGREIVEKLGGSPLLVKTIGSLLYSVTDVDEWHNFREAMLQVDANNVLLTLKVSYDRMLSHLKRCFEFCSIFPKGYVFDKDELLRLWMALGLVEATNDQNHFQMERKGRRYFDELLWRSFFQNVDGRESGVHKEYQMPSLIHELALMVSTFECFTTVGSDVNGDFLSTRYAFYKEPRTFKRIAEYKCLRALILHGQDEEKTNLEKVFCGSRNKMRFLRVLDLRCNQFKELQDWITELTLLRYLALRGSQIQQLPESIGSLLKLETLELNGCNKLVGLPDSIGNLKNLKYLGLGQTAMTSLPETFCNITNLQKLDLRDCSGFSELPNDIDKLKSLTHLNLNHTCVKKLPDSVSKLAKLSVLDLGDCYELEELPRDLCGLTNLRRLYLHLDWEKWDRNDFRSFPQEIGRLKYLQTLSRFSVGKVHNCGVQQLKDLFIEGELYISKLENVSDIKEVESANIGKKSRIELLILR